MTDDTAPAREKRMARDYFFPTPVYHTDLAQAHDLNARLVADIRAWRARDPGGTFRSNVPQLGGWHSATDMHLRSEFTELTREIFELIHGVFADQGYDDAYEPVCDSMWANVNPRGAFNRHHTHPHALWSGVYYVRTPDDCGLLCLTDPPPAGARDHAVLRSEAPLRAYLGRGLLPAGGRPARRLPRMARPLHASEHGERRTGGGGRYEARKGARGATARQRRGGVRGEERISVSFNFRQRRKDADRAAAPANEVVRADLPAR